MANETKVPNRAKWHFGDSPDFPRKDELAGNYVLEMLNRTQRIFEWKGLPDSIPQKDLEFILQRGGYAFIVRNDGKNARSPDGLLYATYGGWGGKMSPYYLPIEGQIANPWLKYDGMVTLGEDAEIILNDSNYMGLLPIDMKYAYLLAETDLSLRLATINSRIIKIIKTGNDAQKKSALEYLRQVEDGEHLGVLAADDFLDQLGTEDYSVGTDGTHIKELIEEQQYLKSQWYIELGLNSNYNMKREAINSAESGMNDDILMPLIDDMLECRRKACERINKLFGTDISVGLSSSWEQNAIEEGEGNDEYEDQGSPAGSAEASE